jgi:uncharacterized delta-60 repeat protein
MTCRRRIRCVGFGLTLGLAAFLATVQVLALQKQLPGDLDSGFGTGGKVTTDVRQDDAAADVAVLSGGEIIVVGTSDRHGTRDYVVARYVADGSLDTSFGGGDGIVTTTVGGSGAGAGSMALQGDGKIVVGGASGTYAGEELTLVRYETAGSLDTGFGDGGIVTTVVPGSSKSTAAAVAVQSDGGILAAGTALIGSYDILLARYDEDGNLDSTFNSTGILTTDLGGWEFGYAMTLQDDGKIVVAGTTRSQPGPHYDIAVTRYMTTGMLDNSFGTGGVVTTSIGDYDAAYAVAVQMDDKIVVAGMADGRYLMVARYSPAGVLDATFGGDGVFTSTLCREAFDLAFLPCDAGILVAGSSGMDPYRDFAVVLLDSTGALDPEFDGDGVAIVDFSKGDDGARALALQPDGKVVVAGESENGGDFDLALVRLLGPITPRAYLPLVVRRYP